MGPDHSITAGVNWAKAYEVGLGLVISPIVGFAAAALLLITLKILVRNPHQLRQEPGTLLSEFCLQVIKAKGTITGSSIPLILRNTQARILTNFFHQKVNLPLILKGLGQSISLR
jgi:phosphate/sulfate permease